MTEIQTHKSRTAGLDKMETRMRVDTDTPPLPANDDEERQQHIDKRSAESKCRLIPGSTGT